MKRLKLAMQRKGRLTEVCKPMLCNLGFTDDTARDLIFASPNEPIDVCFVRDEDIPMLVANNACDFGIVGLNVYRELAPNVQILRKDNYCDPVIFDEFCIAKCRLSVAISATETWAGVQSLEGKTIATSYINETQRYLDENKVNAKTIFMAGSVEIALRLGLADVIIDIVESGKTLLENGLKEATPDAPLINSQMIAICNPGLTDRDISLIKSITRKIKQRT